MESADRRTNNALGDAELTSLNSSFAFLASGSPSPPSQQPLPTPTSPALKEGSAKVVAAMKQASILQAPNLSPSMMPPPAATATTTSTKTSPKNPTNKAFTGYFSEAAAYTLNEVNKCFFRASIGVFASWLLIVRCVYCWTPAEHFRPATKIERQTSTLGSVVLVVSLLTKCIPVCMRGWKFACSGAMVGAVTVQVIAVSTNLLMVLYPMPVMIDPVTHQESYLLRLAEWTVLTFMMCFLTEGVGVKDMPAGAKVWDHVRLPVLLSLSQSLSVFQMFLFLLAPNVIVWTFLMMVGMITFSFMFPRLLYKRDQYLTCPKGMTVDQRETYDRAHLSYKLMALCVTIWTLLVVVYYAAWFLPKIVPSPSLVHKQGFYYVVEVLFEVISKVLYLHLTVDIHSAVFDEGRRAARRLDELRQMMSVVWEMEFRRDCY